MNNFFSTSKKRITGLQGIILVFAILISGMYLHTRTQEQQKPGKKSIPPSKPYIVKQIQGKIKIDGKLDDEAWKQATKIPLPYEYWPGDNIPALVKTEILVTFSKSKLYIGGRCYDPEPGKIRAHLMDRDAIWTFIQDDFVSIFIDTFNDERRAFDFRVNPLGVQMDGMFNEIDGTQDFSWDAIWETAARITAAGYVLEIAIPFNQLRFPATKEKQTWGFSIGRSYPRTARHRFISHPMDRNSDILLPLTNKVTGFENMETGRNLEFDPTLISRRTDRQQDIPGGEMETGKIKTEPGITAHWGITPGLILNAAINPDFSQVEADVAQLEVNTRFSLRYPEKRPFFLEGQDFFQTHLEAVFTRTVSDPLWGVKMTGKTGRNALGFFLNQDRYNNLLFPSNQGSQAASLEENVFGGVFRYRRDVGKGSTLGILYTGRTSSDYFNHVGGLDAFFRLSETKSIGVQFLRTRTRYPGQIAENFQQPTGTFSGNGIFFNVRHSGRQWAYGFEYENLSPGFRTDTGFIPRVDIRRGTAFVNYQLWGKSGGWYDMIIFAATGDYITNHRGELTDRVLQLFINYQGPLQTIAQPLYLNKRERYNGILFDMNQLQFYMEMQPKGGLKYFIFTSYGDTIDYTNSRQARSILINPGVEIGLGRHLNINLNHIFEHLSLKGEKIYTVNLFQARLLYNFNVRTFIRAIIQYMDINRNISMYSFPLEPVTRTMFTQLLFSYKINPRTVLFVGYSDNHLGMKGIDLTRTDRTFFLKIGYALVL
jgi:hypothetical protein